MAAVILTMIAISVFMLRMNHILDYHWEWGRIPSYFFFWDRATGELMANILAKGFATTVKLSLLAMGFAFLLGTVSWVMGAKGSWAQRLVSRIYVETIRNIPSLVLLIIFYYFVSSRFLDALGLDQYLRDAPVWIQQVCGFFLTGPDRINAFMSAGIALGLYEGAYISEIVRGGNQFHIRRAVGSRKIHWTVWKRYLPACGFSSNNQKDGLPSCGPAHFRHKGFLYCLRHFNPGIDLPGHGIDERDLSDL